MKDSGLLGIRTVRRNGNFSVNAERCNFQSQWRALNEPECVLEIGQLSYQFAYTVPADKEEWFQNRKREFYQKYVCPEPPIESVSVTPSFQDVRIGQWTILKTAGEGGRSVIKAAASRTGALVAVKQLEERTDDNSADKERTLYRNLRDDLQKAAQRASKELDHVMLLHADVLTGTRPPRDIYLFFTPLVSRVFHELVQDKGDPPRVGRDTRLKLFSQVTQGLHWIHEAKWIHRDLKPKNLGIKSIIPPHAFILDLDCAKKLPSNLQIQTSPGYGGTIGYIAPEMESSRSTYTQSVDIFALGCVGSQLFKFSDQVANPFGWRYNAFREVATFVQLPVDYSREHLNAYWNLCNTLNTSHDGIGRLLGHMLKFEPRDRPTTRALVRDRQLCMLEGDGASSLKRRRETGFRREINITPPPGTFPGE